MESALWHFGASGAYKVPHSEWPNKRDGQHIGYESSVQPLIAEAYLNVGDILWQEAMDPGTLVVVTVEGVDEGQSVITGTP